MLIADKQNLETAYRVRMFQIRERELDFFMVNSRNVAQLSTLVMGFAMSGLIQIRYVDQNLCGESQLFCAEFLYPCFLALAFGFGNLCLWGCMLSTMLAPGMALHGTQGYFNKCVDWVEEEFQYSLFLMMCALVCVGGCAISWVWTHGTRYIVNDVMQTAVVITTAFLVSVVIRHLQRQFTIPDRTLVIGKWSPRVVTPQHTDGYHRLNDEEPAVPSNDRQVRHGVVEAPSDRLQARGMAADAGDTSMRRPASSSPVAAVGGAPAALTRVPTQLLQIRIERHGGVFGLKLDAHNCVLVVGQGSAGERCGLQVGDVVVACDGMTLTGELAQAMRGRDRAELNVQRRSSAATTKS